jgi:hypothetical protein
MTVDDEDDLEKVISALIVTGDHAAIERYTAKFLAIHPYDFENLYYYACALLNLQRKDEAKSIYLRLYSVYGAQGRAQYFLRKIDGDITVFYNSPLPFDYFKTLSDLFGSVTKHESFTEAFGTDESRELIGLALKLEELRTDILDYLAVNISEPGVYGILKNMFLDIGADTDFKETAVRRLLSEGKEFLFECVTRSSSGRLVFDGTDTETGVALFDRAYLTLLSKLLLRAPNELDGGARYKECFQELASRTADESLRLVLENYVNEKALAAAVYFIMSKKPKGAVSKVAKLFHTTAASLKRFIKLIGAE